MLDECPEPGPCTETPSIPQAALRPEVAAVVRLVWESLDYVCAERVTPALPAMAKHLAQWEEVVLTDEVLTKLGTIHRSTVQRLLQRFQLDTPKLPRPKPQPPNRVLRSVPMERLSWAITVPGTFETDLVHHSGPVTEGTYLHTLQLVDIATGWSERVAVRGRSQEQMEVAFRGYRRGCPSPLRTSIPTTAASSSMTTCYATSARPSRG